MTNVFDNEALFDAEGHLTDDGLQALQDDRLDELGRLEAAEHLSFCDYCLMRYTELVEAMPERMQAPMRDLVSQVQAMMRLRSFRIMTNRYASTAAAVVLAFIMWETGVFATLPTAAAQRSAKRTESTGPRTSAGMVIGSWFNQTSNGIEKMFSTFTATAQDGMAQLADPGTWGGASDTTVTGGH